MFRPIWLNPSVQKQFHKWEFQFVSLGGSILSFPLMMKCKSINVKSWILELYLTPAVPDAWTFTNRLSALISFVGNILKYDLSS